METQRQNKWNVGVLGSYIKIQIEHIVIHHSNIPSLQLEIPLTASSLPDGRQVCLCGDPALQKSQSYNSYGRWRKFANSVIKKVLICHILRISCHFGCGGNQKSPLILKPYRSNCTWHGICSILHLEKPKQRPMD